ncbi:MAG: hypothetical protein O9270_06115 [Aquidulcibacter sp.]|uniref:hypothetical protein n=1 Tax=Aquidulcibacter sp. TaxID=2052990 RepID=UPI0022CA7241|nr:hypothetical protein [Aquidulcibacter sp.]MCE2889993.1 hypothetical protein [Hyphomonadaceae bacterium]MCZ8207754.1 hypothetical protein [Aquidulcibacter sp.]
MSKSFVEIAGSMLIQADAVQGTHGLEALRAKLSAVDLHFVPRHPAVWARPGRCYWNVRDCVAESGGRIRFGWLVVEIAALTLLAWHHAVWQQADGQLLDITPHMQTGWGQGTTTFLEDPKQNYDLSWPPAKIQQFEPLIRDARLNAFIEAYQAQFALQRAYLEKQRGVAGIEFDDVNMRLHAEDPISGVLLQDLERTWQPKIQAADALRGILLDGLVACQNERLQQAA